MKKKYDKKYYTKLIIVNLITSIRLIACFVIPFVYHFKGASITAICVLFVFLTDMIDGYLARHFSVQTFLGSLLDGVSDKLFSFISFFILGLIKPVMFIPLVLEICIFLINIFAYKQNKNVKSSKIGKGKTVILAFFVILSFILVGMDLINLPSSLEVFLLENENAIFYIFAGIIVGSELLTLTDYSKKAFKDGTDSIKEIRHKKLVDFKTIKGVLIDTEFYMQNKDKALRELIYK